MFRAAGVVAIISGGARLLWLFLEWILTRL